MGNKVSKFSCGLINKKGKSNDGLIVANSRPSPEKNSSDKNSTDKEINNNPLYRKNSLIKEKIKKIEKDFFVDHIDINNLFSFYSKKLSKNGKYIEKQDLYDLCDITEPSDEICPYIEHFWENIQKAEEQRVYFDELVIYLISFCICSNYQLIEFVFGLIDKNNNKFISYEEIVKLISQKYNQREIFKYNHYEQIKQYNSSKIKIKDKISIDDFLIICLDNPFIFYPAVKLQNLLKSNYIGAKFWKKLNKKITKSYMDSNADIEHKQLQNNINDIRNKVINERMKSFKERWEKEKEDRKKHEIYKEHIRLGPERKNSDSNFYIDKYMINGWENKFELKKVKNEKDINKLFFDKQNINRNKKDDNKKDDNKNKSYIILEKLKRYKSTPNIDINKKLYFIFIEE